MGRAQGISWHSSTLRDKGQGIALAWCHFLASTVPLCSCPWWLWGSCVPQGSLPAQPQHLQVLLVEQTQLHSQGWLPVGKHKGIEGRAGAEEGSGPRGSACFGQGREMDGPISKPGCGLCTPVRPILLFKTLAQALPIFCPCEWCLPKNPGNPGAQLRICDLPV